MAISESDWWRNKRINDNILVSNPKNICPIEEHLQVIPSELKFIRQDFKRKSSELGKKIDTLEEEKMELGFDVDVKLIFQF